MRELSTNQDNTWVVSEMVASQMFLAQQASITISTITGDKDEVSQKQFVKLLNQEHFLAPFLLLTGDRRTFII